MDHDAPLHGLRPWQQAALLSMLSLVAGALITHGFSGAVDGFGDSGLWVDNGYYFARFVTFSPLPSLNLVNDSTFYPHGVNHVFSPWAFESNYFYALWFRLFGHGPWLQMYLVLSFAAQSLGLWALLRGRFGSLCAFSAAAAVTFGNAYLIFKYPGHAHLTAVHWTVLGMACDVILFQRLHDRQPLSMRFLLLRACLAVLSLGQELAYVAAYGLAMLTVTALWGAALGLARGALLNRRCWRDCAARWAEDVRAAVWVHGGLLLLLLAGCFLYLPLALEVLVAARSFDMTGIPSGIWFSNPFRLFVPYLPWVNPGWLPNLLDRPEGLGAGSPGLSLTLLGMLGLWCLRRRLLAVGPLLTFFAMLLVYIPDLIPTLSVFPWMTFDRVGSRATLVYPALLVLLAIHGDWRAWGRRGRVLLVLLLTLGLIEAGTVYTLSWQRDDPKPSADFMGYMRTVRDTPGEAVLDWPFCAAGGNSVGRLELCPLFPRLNPVYAFRKFHEKKVLGQYLGRLHPAMIRPYLDEGLGHLVRPNVRNEDLHLKQECLTTAEWEFFDAYLSWYDFAGINVYLDALSPACVASFFERFGDPAATTQHFQVGRMAFIPKGADRRGRSGVGPPPRYAPPVSESFDLAAVRFPYGVVVQGLGEPVSPASGGTRLPMQGMQARVAFALDAEVPLRVHYRLGSKVIGQSVVLRFNGTIVGTHADLQDGMLVSGGAALQGRAGHNELSIVASQPPRSPMATSSGVILRTLAEHGMAGLLDQEELRERYRFAKGQTLWFEQLLVQLRP